jgi:hypothetical protein
MGKLLLDKGIGIALYVPVQHMAGTGYVERGLHFFFLPLITFEVARVRGYLRKSEGSLPVKLNYVVKNRCL